MFALHVCFLSCVYLLLVHVLCAHDFPCTCIYSKIALMYIHVLLLVCSQETREKEEKRKKEYEAELERQLYEHRKALGHFN